MLNRFVLIFLALIPAALSIHHVLFFAIPLPGHLNPLIMQAKELARRGFHVTIASSNEIESHIWQSSGNHEPWHDRVHVITVGPCSPKAHQRAVFDNATKAATYADGQFECPFMVLRGISSCFDTLVRYS
jgi:hypothetical protein